MRLGERRNVSCCIQVVGSAIANFLSGSGAFAFMTCAVWTYLSPVLISCDSKASDSNSRHERDHHDFQVVIRSAL